MARTHSTSRPGTWRARDAGTVRRRALIAVAALSVAAILLTRKPHVYEFVHFFLGAKYFPEVGYTGLYVDLAAAFAELRGPAGLNARVGRVTDLARVGSLSADEAVRAHRARAGRWTPERWRDFKADVAFLDEAMARYAGPRHLERWREIFRDYGNNFPPAWVAWVHPLTRALPLGWRSLLALCAIDGALLAGVFAAAGAAWGLGAAVTGLVFVASATDLMSYASWSLGKFDWLCALALALLLLERGRHRAAGALWGIATALRLFPALPAALLAALWAHGCLGRRESLRGPLRFAGSAVAAFLGANAAATALVARWSRLPAWELWAQYRDRLGVYQRDDVINRIGLVKLVDAAPGGVSPLVGAFAATLLAALLLLALARWRPSPGRLGALSLLFTPLVVPLSHYYYLFLLLPLAAGGRRLAWLAAVLVAVNGGVLAATAAGLPVGSVLQGESLAYSFVLATVPLALFLRGAEPDPGATGGAS